VRVYCTNNDSEHLSIVKEAFTRCCDDEGYPKPKVRINFLFYLFHLFLEFF
jgi:hypothetical protein